MDTGEKTFRQAKPSSLLRKKRKAKTTRIPPISQIKIFIKICEIGGVRGVFAFSQSFGTH